MKLKIMLLVFFLIILTNNVYSQDILQQVSSQESITLKDTSEILELTITNTSSQTRWVNIKTHMSPFTTHVDNPYFSLEPNLSKTIKIEIIPLKKTLNLVYKTTIEISSEDYIKNLPITIFQQKNIECFVEIKEIVLRYKEDKYVLDLELYNNKETTESTIIKEIRDVNNNIIKNIDQELQISGKNNLWLSYDFVVDENKTVDKVYLVYGCDEYQLNHKEITLIIDEEPKQPLPKTNVGLFVLSSAKSFYNSVIFQILLVIILIILVLSFTTRYIQYVYNR